MDLFFCVVSLQLFNELKKFMIFLELNFFVNRILSSNENPVLNETSQFNEMESSNDEPSFKQLPTDNLKEEEEITEVIEEVKTNQWTKISNEKYIRLKNNTDLSKYFTKEDVPIDIFISEPYSSDKFITEKYNKKESYESSNLGACASHLVSNKEEEMNPKIFTLSKQKKDVEKTIDVPEKKERKKRKWCCF